MFRLKETVLHLRMFNFNNHFWTNLAKHSVLTAKLYDLRDTRAVIDGQENPAINIQHNQEFLMEKSFIQLLRHYMLTIIINYPSIHLRRRYMRSIDCKF